ncbi:MAG: hypothetical protein ACKOAX_13345, partial [Candidatus Kapaibacterium sp.]
MNYRTAQTGGVVSYDSTFTRTATSSMPSTFGVGASYRRERLLFLADAEVQTVDGMSYRMQNGTSYNQASRVGLGLSRLGSRSAGVSYAEKMNLNAGLGIRNLHYSFFGETVTEQYGTFGVQMPFGGAAMVD